jgi:hypothetical protein
MPVCFLFTGVTQSLTRHRISPPAGRKIPCFFPKMLHFVQHFWEKDQEVPCCRRRIQPWWKYISDFYTHRVTRVIHRSYAVGSKPGVCLDNRPDSPPAGWNGTFFLFPEKEKNVPCGRRRNTLLSRANGPFERAPRNSCYSIEPGRKRGAANWQWPERLFMV